MSWPKFLAQDHDGVDIYVTKEQVDWIVDHQDMGCVQTFLALYDIQRRGTDPGGNALMVCAWEECMEAREKLEE